MRKLMIPVLAIALLPLAAAQRSVSAEPDDDGMAALTATMVDTEIASAAQLMRNDIKNSSLPNTALCLRIGALKEDILKSYDFAGKNVRDVDPQTQDEYDQIALQAFWSTSEAYHVSQWTLGSFCDDPNGNYPASIATDGGDTKEWIKNPVPAGDTAALVEKLQQIEDALRRKATAELQLNSSAIPHVERTENTKSKY